jgi:hypothetical protein
MVHLLLLHKLGLFEDLEGDTVPFCPVLSKANSAKASYAKGFFYLKVREVDAIDHRL